MTNQSCFEGRKESRPTGWGGDGGVYSIVEEDSPFDKSNGWQLGGLRVWGKRRCGSFCSGRRNSLKDAEKKILGGDLPILSNGKKKYSCPSACGGFGR